MNRNIDHKGELTSMSLGDHLEELRSRLVLIVLALLVGLVICMFFGKFLISVLASPYNRAMGNPDNTMNLQTIEPMEGFVVYIRICLFFGLLVSSPVVFWQIWAFISAGLYKREKKFIHTVAPVSAILFVSGAVLFMAFIAPVTMKFLMQFNKSLSLTSNWTFQSYISMVLSLTLIFGLAFQSPIAIVFAERMGLVSIELLRTARRYIIIGIVIIAAAILPGSDPFSLIALVVPLYILYEGSILTCLFLRKRQREKNMVK